MIFNSLRSVCQYLWVIVNWQNSVVPFYPPKGRSFNVLNSEKLVNFLLFGWTKYVLMPSLNAHSYLHLILLEQDLNKNYIYTERQKKFITSPEWHSLNSKALKWIVIGHRLAIVLLAKHIPKNKRLLEPKRSKIRWNCKRSFFKIHRNCSPPGHRAWHRQ